MSPRRCSHSGLSRRDTSSISSDRSTSVIANRLEVGGVVASPAAQLEHVAHGDRRRAQEAAARRPPRRSRRAVRSAATSRPARRRSGARRTAPPPIVADLAGAHSVGFARMPAVAPATEFLPVPRRGRRFSRPPAGSASPMSIRAAGCASTPSPATSRTWRRTTRRLRPRHWFGWVVRRTLLDVVRPAGLAERPRLTTYCTGTGRSWAERRTSIIGEAARRPRR